MQNRFEEKPTLFVTVVLSLVLAIVLSLVYASRENYFAETSAIFTFILSLAISSRYFSTNRCISIIIRTLCSGGLAGVVYWFAQSSELGLINAIVYGALIGLVWMIVDGIGSNESCT